MSYFLHVNLAIYEHEHGSIKLPAAVVPPPPAEDTGSKELAAKIQEIRRRFLEGT